MLGFDRHAARWTWTVLAVLLLVCLVYLVRSTLLVFTIALLFAYLLYPLVNLIDRAMPWQRTRGLALTLAYLIFLGVGALVAVQVGSRVTDQAQTLGKKFPEMLARWEVPPADEPAGDLKAQIAAKVRVEIGRRANDLANLVPSAGVKLMSVASDLIFVVLVPILAFFFLKDGEEIRAHILGLVESGSRRAWLDSLMVDVHHLLAHYMRALVMLCVATFVAYSITFTVIGLPFGVLLATVAMCLEIIPSLGPLVAALIIILVSAISGSHVLALIVFLLLYRLFQDYVLSPHLMGQGVQLHSLLVLFGVFAGAEVAGVAGSFLSVPLLALVRVFYLHLRRSRAGTPAEPARLVR
jgi:predicted PurR-regulated permease PerM